MTDKIVTLDVNAIRIAADRPLQLELVVNGERVAFSDTGAARDFAWVLLKVANVLDEANTGAKTNLRPKLSVVKGL